jgi:hypothetical protein
VNPYSTVRNSKATAFAWKSKLDFESLQHIQSHCTEPMQRLGYRQIGSLQDWEDPDFQILDGTPKDLSDIRLDPNNEN